VAHDDAGTTSEDTALVVDAAHGVLANDSDVDGDPLAAVLATGPAHGTLTLNANGSFTYTPAADFNGADTFSYRASAAALDSAPAMVAITVMPVNAAPAFTKGPDEQVTENTGPQTIPGWATAITAGPPDESSQALTFLISADTPSLFSAQPGITPSGTLTFTSAQNATGSAIVTVRLRDDGGTASGGVDTSAP